MSAAQAQRVAFTDKDKVEFIQCERPNQPLEPNEVAGRTLCTLISAGTELATLAKTTPEAPCFPGYAAVFEVESVGQSVNDLKPGDVAFSMGGHRSFQRHNRQDVLPVPKGLAPEQAVFARLMNVTWSTLVTTTARPPAKVIVTGLGLVGHLGAKIFASCGYEVLGVDPVAARGELLQGTGLRGIVPAVPLGDPEWQDQVDLVVDCSGHEKAVLDGCKIVRKRGEVVCVGAPWKRYTEIYAHDLIHAVFHKYVVLRSGWEWEVPHQPVNFVKNSLFGDMAGALKWIEAGRIKIDGLYELRAPKDAPAAYESLRKQTCPKLAIVFDWRKV
ncbi:MAG: dehydrogenase [Planctomycetes bacterium]|nr:dehydrogenase [Planctomycetota bacterium]